jgi:membrane-associated protein
LQLVHGLIYFITHIREVLTGWAQSFGTGVYFLMFLVVFAETGLVVTPFLPGDSLLFAAGILSATGPKGPPVLNVWLSCLTFLLAAFVGDNVNYWFGRELGPRMLKNENSRIFRKSYLDSTKAFFAEYGSSAVILARFVPIVRTFAPFMAGVGHMNYGRYIAYSFAGSVMWVGVFVSLGYFLGSLQFVQDHFEWALVVMVLISLLPGVYHYARGRMKAGKTAAQGASPTRDSE